MNTGNSEVKVRTKIEKKIQNDVGVEMVMDEGEVDRSNVDDTPLGEAPVAPSSRKKIATEVISNNYLESEELQEKKIAYLTNVSNLPKSTVVMNDSSNVCIEVSDIPISTSVHEHVNQSISTDVDSTVGEKNYMTDSNCDVNPNVDVFVENLNHIEEFQNDFDSYYDEDSNKSFFTADASVKNYADEAI